ncbi:MAG: hypothetical protein NT105_00755 [Verrucomicrobia bacterium]|nr:hypothetical protein [Verrucomicrobiota bacterium]
MTTRTGKIARLPLEVKTELNRRLRDGESGPSLLKWLNALPETKAVMAAQFHSQPVSEQNMSQWRRGGYKQWLAHQEILASVNQTLDDAAQIKDATPGSLTDAMASLLTARLSVVLADLKTQGTDGKINYESLHALCVDLVELRRGDQNAERLQIEHKRLELEREHQAAMRERTVHERIEEFWEWASHEEIRHEICRGYKTSEERMKLLVRLMFGERPKHTMGPPGFDSNDQPCGCGPQSESNQIKADQTTPSPDKESQSSDNPAPSDEETS